MRDYYYERDTGIGNFEWRDSGNKCGDGSSKKTFKSSIFQKEFDLTFKDKNHGTSVHIWKPCERNIKKQNKKQVEWYQLNVAFIVFLRPQ